MTTIDTTALVTALPEAAKMVHGWNSGEVLNHMNMSEGFTLAALFRALGDHGTADYIIREVWEGEGEDDRDPEPWIIYHYKGDKRFATKEAADASPLGRGRFAEFEPRIDWDTENEED